MFKQFAIARFMIGFIIFILAYMVGSLYYDIFIHFLTAGLFILSLWIMHEAQLGHKEQLAALQTAYDEKIRETETILEEKEAEIDRLYRLMNIQQGGQNDE